MDSKQVRQNPALRRALERAAKAQPQFEIGVRLPARLFSEHLIDLLNIKKHDVPVLISAGLLPVLGSPAQNGRKYFARVEIEFLAKDRDWLYAVTDYLIQYWKDKNLNRDNEDLEEAA